MPHRILVLLAATVGLAPSALAADVLYCNDYVITTDRMAEALAGLSASITLTSTTSITSCEEYVTSGEWDLVILGIQNSSYSTPNFDAWVSAGGAAILQDWTMEPTRGALFGVTYSGSNLAEVTVTDDAFATGLASNPFPLTNPGWGIYSMTMAATSGASVLATFSSDAAVVLGAGGNTIVNGFLTDTGDDNATTLYTNEIQYLLGTLVVDRDADDDGYDSDVDCDDADPAVNPGADERCDEVDNDCDGTVDEADAVDASDWYADSDEDGYGDGGVSETSCYAPALFVADASDCDDGDFGINPGATEVCDAANTDEDCDGAADDADASTSASTKSTWYRDFDSDGYGGDTLTQACDVPSGFVAIDGDCDDGRADIHVGATQIVGDGLDQTCTGSEICYVDGDVDGWRTGATVASGDTDCNDPGEALSSAPSVDCDDADAAINPDVAETVGDGVDSDCDGGEICYLDDDGDGYRPDASATVASADDDCADDGEARLEALTGDCDDDDGAYNPGAVEDDCTDPNDYNCDGSVAFSDADADGWAACRDCDDGDRDVRPDGTEIAGDQVDSDCDGVDLCFADADDDGYRPDDSEPFEGTTVACDGDGEASGFEPDGDCDDADAAVNPGATEIVGDDFDQDCDATDLCYVDADGDGYRSDETVESTDSDCDDEGEAYPDAALDCDDGDATIRPDGVEIAGDGIDQDCDTMEWCLVDVDADGYRPDDTTSVLSEDLDCTGEGEAALTDPGGDCDDADATISPEGTEIAGDEVDQDCDGTEWCVADADSDGYFGDDTALVASTDTDCQDEGEAALSGLGGDCDDADPAYNPGAVEDDCADPNDYNCDGSVGYADGDGDGFAACTECNDTDATVYPGAEELAGDLVDQNCDATELCYVDADDDGWRPDASTVSSANLACDGAGEAVGTDGDGDCDDVDAGVYPGATEVIGDAIDQDCDGAEICYVDSDADGYRPVGEDRVVVSEDADCLDVGEAGATVADGDCNDADAAYNPGIVEDCADPTDYNCDGSVGYADGDGDGFAACEECDDGAAGVNPDADEVCNAIDDDCDGTVDVDAIDAATWYADADGDGYTDAGESVTACDEPAGFGAASAEDDCDDADATSYPGAEDAPGDDIDQDCDGADAIPVEDDPDEDDGKDEGTCGCASTDTPSGLALLGLVPLLVAARRRKATK